MSNYDKFSLAERAYGKGRKTRFVCGNIRPDRSLMESDVSSIGGSVNDEELYKAWMEGFKSDVNTHNPLPKQTQFEAPPIIQKIKFDNMTRGVVMAFLKGGNIWIGWSIRRTVDKYDPEKAVVDARVNAVPLHTFSQDRLPNFYKGRRQWVFTRDGNVATDRNGDPIFEYFEDTVKYTVFKVIGRALHYYQQATFVV